MQLFSYTLHGWANPADVFCLLYSNDRAAFWLDREHHPDRPFSVLGHAYADQVFGYQEALEAMTKLTDSQTESPEIQELPFEFRPGLVGWFEYREPNTPMADLRAQLMLVREALIFDHTKRRITILGLFDSAEDFEQWRQGVALRIWFSGGQQVGYRMRATRHYKTQEALQLRDDSNSYIAKINRVKEHIARGDVYQLCLTNRISGLTDRDPLAVFLRLRAANPAPYATYIRVGSRALVSSSPEEFLHRSSKGLVSTKPIKGTRPRNQDPGIDGEIAAELATNPKERAENLMIVDLMRNDLGRICATDTVTVTELFKVESYATVHQLVSTITGQQTATGSLGEQLNCMLDACFPAGSMTGAPKLRAMELIDEIEASPRGIYSGIAGYLGIDGSVELGMNIRSLVFEGEEVSIGVGGGITADSDPAAELAETQVKAGALLEALEASNPWSTASGSGDW